MAPYGLAGMAGKSQSLCCVHHWHPFAHQPPSSWQNISHGLWRKESCSELGPLHGDTSIKQKGFPGPTVLWEAPRLRQEALCNSRNKKRFQLLKKYAGCQVKLGFKSQFFHTSHTLSEVPLGFQTPQQENKTYATHPIGLSKRGRWKD